MTQTVADFFAAYPGKDYNQTVYTPSVPPEMMVSAVDKDGWFEWKVIKGTLTTADYEQIEREFSVQLPKSFIRWHQSHFFFEVNSPLFRLPGSLPTEPLKEIINSLDWSIPEQLIPQKIYPFGSDGNDVGPLVFDGRVPVNEHEFPIRMYDHEFGGDAEGLSEVIFSSFTKLLECLTHFFTNENGSRDFSDIILDFLAIDPEGAGKTGRDYWLRYAG